MIQTASKTHSAVQMVRTALERAHHYQDTHHIFTFINDEAALAKATTIDQRIQRGESVGASSAARASGRWPASPTL